MIESGLFETGLGFGKVRNLAQAEERLSKLRGEREKEIAKIKELRLASIQVKTLPNEISALNQQIDELAKAIKENPAQAANIITDGSTTNNNFNNAQSVIAADNLGFNTDNFEFRAVR